jgi:hypothetical protein
MNASKVDELWFARDMVALRRPLRLTGRWRRPKDGLWMVKTRRGVRGGYLVYRGRVVRCSPVLRHHIHVWAMRNAEWFCLV